MDVLKIKEDIAKRGGEVKILIKKIPAFVAGAAEKMKDANFAAEGFVRNGTASPKWTKRRKETGRSTGKRILHSSGYMQNNVKSKATDKRVHVGVDLSKVPYAQVHNDGGKITQQVKVHTRKHYKTGKQYRVKAHSRTLNMPQRKYLGYTPDIEKITDKEVKYQMDKIFKR